MGLSHFFGQILYFLVSSRDRGNLVMFLRKCVDDVLNMIHFGGLGDGDITI